MRYCRYASTILRLCGTVVLYTYATFNPGETGMDDEQYEKAYGDAREALNRRGKKVGAQTLRPDGARYSIIDGRPLTDEEVFTLAWSEEIAREICRERIDPAPLIECCHKGARLWQRYAQATAHYVKLLAAAALHDTTPAIRGPRYQRAAAEHRATRHAVRAHAAAHAGECAA